MLPVIWHNSGGQILRKGRVQREAKGNRVKDSPLHPVPKGQQEVRGNGRNDGRLE